MSDAVPQDPDARDHDPNDLSPGATGDGEGDGSDPTLFHPDNRRRSPDHARVYAIYEVAYTVVDFLAAACFIGGSVMFFFDSWMVPGTWAFLVGSFLFAAKPSLRLAREITYLRMGDVDRLAERYEQ
ncbi:MAG: YrhK family protein [Celeribacter sp.]